jgi:hypothetical protein
VTEVPQESGDIKEKEVRRVPAVLKANPVPEEKEVLPGYWNLVPY